MSDVVTVSQLRKSYGALVAVDALDLTVPKGAIFGLLGPNGAGKSTTFGVLCGWLKADRGSATILGMPSAKLHRLRGKVSAMPQDAAFSPQISIEQQLTYFAELCGMSRAQAVQESQRVLDVVSLRDAARLRGG